MQSYPRKIGNGSGEELTFLDVVRDQDGERIEVERCPISLPQYRQQHTESVCGDL